MEPCSVEDGYFSNCEKGLQFLREHPVVELSLHRTFTKVGNQLSARINRLSGLNVNLESAEKELPESAQRIASRKLVVFHGYFQLFL